MNSSTRFLIALLLVIASSVGSPTPCWADAIVTLHGDVELSRPTVRLSDLFVGVPDGIDRDIAMAPAPGKQATYDSNLLNKLADKYRLDWHANSPVDHVTITSGYTRITTEAISTAIADRIKETRTKGNISVAFDGHAPVLDLPANQSTAFTLANFDYDEVSKHFHGDVVASTGQGQVSLPINGRAVIKQRIPTLAHKLEAGTIVGLNDVDWIEVTEDRINDGIVTDVRQLADRELRRTLADGEIIHTNDVSQPRLVKRGSLISMKIETPLMSVSAQGKAMQDGTLGDVVKVMNVQSNRMIEGTVTGPDTVTISTPQKLAMAHE